MKWRVLAAAPADVESQLGALWPWSERHAASAQVAVLSPLCARSSATNDKSDRLLDTLARHRRRRMFVQLANRPPPPQARAFEASFFVARARSRRCARRTTPHARACERCFRTWRRLDALDRAARRRRYCGGCTRTGLMARRAGRDLIGTLSGARVLIDGAQPRGDTRS